MLTDMVKRCRLQVCETKARGQAADERLDSSKGTSGRRQSERRRAKSVNVDEKDKKKSGPADHSAVRHRPSEWMSHSVLCSADKPPDAETTMAKRQSCFPLVTAVVDGPGQGARHAIISLTTLAGVLRYEERRSRNVRPSAGSMRILPSTTGSGRVATSTA